MIKHILLFTFVLFLFALSSPAQASKDATIKGEWLGVFSIAGHTADVKLKFDVNEANVSGTVVSEHTGPGIVTDGKWKDGKLACTLKFEKHESIALTGWLKDGRFEGEFKTEGMTGTFTAKRP